MLTLWYFSYHLPSRQLRFCAAGHHPSFLVSGAAPEPAPLWLRGPAIGLLPSGTWVMGGAEMPPGAKLYIFSDGVFEIVTAAGRQWTLEDFRQVLAQPERPGVPEPDRLYQAVRTAARPGALEDDFSVLVVTFQ
jgi:sigma-B regulation protein RsbU (phosphoserine phosphatase)